jgi:hypothetical protein
MKKYIKIWVTKKRMTNKIRSSVPSLKRGLRGRAGFGGLSEGWKDFERFWFLGERFREGVHT